MTFGSYYLAASLITFAVFMWLTYPRKNEAGDCYIPWNRLRGYSYYSTPLRSREGHSFIKKLVPVAALIGTYLFLVSTISVG